ncbi:fatty acid cis/trans isomerase [Aestuariibacter salexigens]|uniref:fatty acid cis/trans isomerase n=1 Tax=Aestuariibacter salexigens TaxID=226010 RepID=UPI0012EBBF30|nr:fatty acid cis/trans isomerase [Aestuariibacter salexigens]
MTASKASFKKWMLVGIAFVLVVFVWVRYFLVQPAVSASRYDAPLISDQLSYQQHIKPILDSRCVVCHGCYDAPCQLKLGSFDGIVRGAHPDPVYNGERLTAALPTRLFEDANTVTEWRKKGFHPVLSEGEANPEDDLTNSVLIAMLEQKQDHPLPETERLPDSFDFDLNRELSCPSVSEHARYEKKYPLWGMPYALPAISNTEHQLIREWVKSSAPTAPIQPLPQALQNQVAAWEQWFNQNGNKQRLVARYLFEHLFMAHLYFSDEDNPLRPKVFFRIFRSRTPPGEPVDIIATRRPFDDPGVDRVYYRIVPVTETIVDKLHLPFALDQERQQKWQTWFFSDDYEVVSLPGYDSKTASNPFITFAQLPTRARYRFMLDEAQYSIMQFIKGAVCRGQIALNVINDHFWVVFADPELDLAEYDEAFMSEARSTIKLPAEADSNALPLNWINYARSERQYLKIKSQYIAEHVEGQIPINLDLIWDGDGNNDNLALTIFRHFDAASVVKGLVGDRPQTAWVITYPLFERIHYLLVAGYDVYGNLGHQLNSRMYMDFLRMEGEFYFLSLLPKAVREDTRKRWYRGSVSMVEEYVYSGNQYSPKTDIAYDTEQPLSELYARLGQYVNHAQSQRHLKNGRVSADMDAATTLLNQVTSTPAQILPQASLVLVDHDDGEASLYTLLSHNAYTNISHLFGEMDRRIPNEDTVTFAPGVMTSHPNALFEVKVSQMQEFAQTIARMNNEQDYREVMTKWGIRRTDPDFWAFSDRLHQHYRNAYPIEFGFFDYNRLENR